MISRGLDNYKQINPTGSRKETINAVDLQYSHFISNRSYWFYALGVGYRGLPLYNQAIGGMGMRFPVAPRVNLYAQLGIGSGGYAPALIDTGSGLLIYPKVSAEYLVRDNIGLALSGGYLFAPDGTSKNLTFGVALNYHLRRQPQEASQGKGRFQGVRFSTSHETAVNVSYSGGNVADLNMLSLQGDVLLNDRFYIPVRTAISYVAYRGYPGYGEISGGIGINSKYNPEKKIQYFAELHGGANVEGGLVRGVVGMQYELNDSLALRGFVGHTRGENGFKSTNVGFGITNRFSLGLF